MMGASAARIRGNSRFQIVEVQDDYQRYFWKRWWGIDTGDRNRNQVFPKFAIIQEGRRVFVWCFLGVRFDPQGGVRLGRWANPQEWEREKKVESEQQNRGAVPKTPRRRKEKNKK